MKPARKKSSAAVERELARADAEAARAAVRWFQTLPLQDRQAYSGLFLSLTHGERVRLTQDDLDDLRVVLEFLITHPDMLSGMAMKLGAARRSMPESAAEPGPEIAGRIGPRGAA